MNTKENLLTAIDSIDKSSSDAECKVLESLVDNYQKAFFIYENYTGDGIDNFSIFQEGSIMDDVKKRGKNQNAFLKVITFIPRLIGAVISAITANFKAWKRKRIADKARRKSRMNVPLSRKEIQAIHDDDKNSVMGKAIAATGCTMAVATTGALVFGLKDYTEAVEFKDDVKFEISEDGKLRIIFPYYKIDQIKKFNKDIDAKITKMQSFVKSGFKDKSCDKLFSEINNCLKSICTNQARISSKNFDSLKEYDNFIDDVETEFEKFQERLKTLQDLFKFNPNDVTLSHENFKSLDDIVDDLKKLVKKTPGDIELITKLDEKINKIYGIITNPNSSKSSKKKAAKFKFVPLDQNCLVDIYKFDTTHLENAIKELNETYKNDDLNKIGVAIREIERQFNIHIDYEIFNGGGATSTHSRDLKPGINEVSLSKSKGFDLGGATLKLYIDPRFVATQIRSSRSVSKPYGQMFCSIICHEIFHNLVKLTNVYRTKLGNTIKDIFETVWMTASSIAGAILKSADIYTNKLSSIFNKSSPKANDLTKRRLAYLHARCKTKKDVEKFTKAIQNGTDEKIMGDVSTKTLFDEIEVRERNAGPEGALMTTFQTFGPIYATCICMIFLGHGLLVDGMMGLCCVFLSTYIFAYNKPMEASNEEQMCDICAAMYKLPVYLSDVRKLMMDGKKRNYSANKQNMHDVHPATYDRQTISYNFAKQMLESGENLSDDVREYLNFIIEMNDGINYTERKLTKKQIKKLAPEFTDDIRSAISLFAQKHNISITECFVEYDDSEDIL